MGILNIEPCSIYPDFLLYRQQLSEFRISELEKNIFSTAVLVYQTQSYNDLSSFKPTYLNINLFGGIFLLLVFHLGFTYYCIITINDM